MGFEKAVCRIASMGGKAAHEKGTAHEWDTVEAMAAGKLGGIASHGGGRRKREPMLRLPEIEGEEVRDQ